MHQGFSSFQKAIEEQVQESSFKNLATRSTKSSYDPFMRKSIGDFANSDDIDINVDRRLRGCTRESVESVYPRTSTRNRTTELRKKSLTNVKESQNRSVNQNTQKVELTRRQPKKTSGRRRFLTRAKKNRDVLYTSWKRGERPRCHHGRQVHTAQSEQKKIDLSKDDDSPGVAQWRKQRKHDAQAERQKQRKEQRFKKKTKPRTNFPRNETREKDQKKMHVEAKAKENNKKNASMDNNVIKLFAQLLERAAVTRTTTPLGA